MGKTVRVLARGWLWQYLAVSLGFVGVSAGGVLLLGYKNLFGTYFVSSSLLCLIFYMMTGVMSGSIWPGIGLSMGATRRQYFAGMQAAMLLGLAGYFALMLAASAIWDQFTLAGRIDRELGIMLLQPNSPAACLQMLGMLALFGQLGLLLGFLAGRIGKVGYAVSMIGVLLVCIALYLVVAFGQSGLLPMPLLLQPGPLGGLCLAAALAAGAACGALMHGYSVK